MVFVRTWTALTLSWLLSAPLLDASDLAKEIAGAAAQATEGAAPGNADGVVRSSRAPGSRF